LLICYSNFKVEVLEKKLNVVNIIKKYKIKIFKKIYTRLIHKLRFNNNYIQIEDKKQANIYFKKHIDFLSKIKYEYDFKTQQTFKNVYPHTIIKNYKGFSYIDVNRFLRGEKLENNNEYNLNKVKLSINVITKELDKFRLPFNLIVLRRVSNSFFNKTLLKGNKYKKSIEFIDNGFLSTSLSTDINYIDSKIHDYCSGKSLMIIKVPKGTSALYIEPIDEKGELELLLERGLIMKTVKRIIFLSRRIYLIEILGSSKKKPNL